MCHSGIGAGEVLKSCPECDTTYHTECWTENFGCSTYGCVQVNILNPAAPRPAVLSEPPTMRSPERVAAPDPAPPIEGEHDEPDEAPTQWEWYVILGALLAAVLGTVTFGLSSLAMGVVASVMIVRRQRDTRVGLLLLAVLVAVLGIGVGLAGSDFLYLNGSHLPGGR